MRSSHADPLQKHLFLFKRSVDERRSYCQWEGRNQWLYDLDHCERLEDVLESLKALERGYPLISTISPGSTAIATIAQLRVALAKTYNTRRREGLARLWNDICTFGEESPPFIPSCLPSVSRSHFKRGLTICLGLDISWEDLDVVVCQIASKTLQVTYEDFLQVFEHPPDSKSVENKMSQVCKKICETIDTSGMDISEVFNWIDRTGDGFVSLAEFVRAFSPYSERRRDLYEFFLSFHPSEGSQGKVDKMMFCNRMLQIYLQRFKRFEFLHSTARSGTREQLVLESKVSRCEEFLYSIYQEQRSRHLPPRTETRQGLRAPSSPKQRRSSISAQSRLQRFAAAQRRKRYLEV